MRRRLLRAMCRARRAPRAREGMTLVEIMIVVIIMALIATGVAVALLPQLEKSKIKETQTSARTLRSAVQLWLADHSGECPTVERLIEDNTLDRGGRTKDAWDNDFVIQCEGIHVTVTSAGPDEAAGSQDDIQVGG